MLGTAGHVKGILLYKMNREYQVKPIEQGLAQGNCTVSVSYEDGVCDGKLLESLDQGAD